MPARSDRKLHQWKNYLSNAGHGKRAGHSAVGRLMVSAVMSTPIRHLYRPILNFVFSFVIIDISVLVAIISPVEDAKRNTQEGAVLVSEADLPGSAEESSATV